MTTSCTSSLSDRHVLWLLFLPVMPSYQSLIVLLFFRRVVAVRAFPDGAHCIFTVIYNDAAWRTPLAIRELGASRSMILSRLAEIHRTALQTCFDARYPARCAWSDIIMLNKFAERVAALFHERTNPNLGAHALRPRNQGPGLSNERRS